MTYLDTHVVLWLFEGLLDKLSSKAIQQLQDDALTISPIVTLEMEFLYEIKRITVPAINITTQLKNEIGLIESSLPMNDIIPYALNQKWTRDPFDRLIVAEAVGLLCIPSIISSSNSVTS